MQYHNIALHNNNMITLRVVALKQAIISVCFINHESLPLTKLIKRKGQSYLIKISQHLLYQEHCTIDKAAQS